MKALYFDCFSGISGDMTLGALIDIGVPEEYLVYELEKLNIGGWSLQTEQHNKNGIEAKYIKVIVNNHNHEHHHTYNHDHDHEHHHTHNHDHEHNSYSDIVELINKSGITDNAKQISKNIFLLVAEAEGKVHGKPIEEVHFHEVGALDSIIDIVGAAICIDYLKPEIVLSSIVNDGHGFVMCQHGQIPVPVPAVVEIFARKNVPSRQIDIDKELVTPTGAAIIAALSKDYGLLNKFKIEKTGYGAGTRDLKIPNVLRVFLGEVTDNIHQNKITIIETNIDDMNPEILAYAMEKLLKAGARDVYFTPVQMKKNRPAIKLTVMCDSDKLDILSSIILTETTTIGIRIREEIRICLPREIKTIQTKYGDVKVKEVSFSGKTKYSVEYEDAKRLAELNNVPLSDIYKEV